MSARKGIDRRENQRSPCIRMPRARHDETSARETGKGLVKGEGDGGNLQPLGGDMEKKAVHLTSYGGQVRSGDVFVANEDFITAVGHSLLKGSSEGSMGKKWPVPAYRT